MPHQPDDADPDRWLRYFAMDANMRAATLLAEVHALLGFGARALAWAVEVRD